MCLTRTGASTQETGLKCVELREFPKRMPQMYPRDEHCDQQEGDVAHSEGEAQDLSKHRK